MRIIGSDKITTISRQVSGYEKIRLSGQGVAQIIQDGSEGLTVQVDDNLVQYLEIGVSDGELVLGEKAGFNLVPSQSIRYTIYVKDLSRIHLSGAGQVQAADLSAGSLSLGISGSGKITLETARLEALDVDISGAGAVRVAGSAERLDLDISGAGDFQAPDFRVQSARLSLSGAGSAEVWVQGSLDVSLAGVGSVRYHGSPVLRKQISGVASVVKLGDK